MAEHIIEVRVDEKIASVVGDPLYVCGNSDYIVKFHFDAEWAGHETKTARFIKSNKEYIDVLFSGNQCAVPIIDNTPYVRIGVYAGNLCTTTAAIVNAQRSILCGSGVPADPDPDIYTQMLEKLDELYLKDVKSDTEKLGGKPASDYAIKSETAPAGYGLGMESAPHVGEDMSKVTKIGIYAMPGSAAINYPDKIPYSNYGTLIVTRRTGKVTQTVNYENYVAMRHSVWTEDGSIAFGEWEYVNPPMSPGVEYRTTERYWGKPVYCKLVDCGALPNASTKLVYYADNGVVNHIVRYSGEMFASGDTFSMPYTMNGVEVCVQAIGRTGINLYASYNASGFAAYVTVWYIKNE